MLWKLRGFGGQRKEAAGEARVLGHQGLDLYLGEEWAGQGGYLSNAGLRKSRRGDIKTCVPPPCQIEYKLQITVHVTVTMGNLKQLVSEYIQDITELLKKKKKKKIQPQ